MAEGLSSPQQLLEFVCKHYVTDIPSLITLRAVNGSFLRFIDSTYVDQGFLSLIIDDFGRVFDTEHGDCYRFDNWTFPIEFIQHLRKLEINRISFFIQYRVELWRRISSEWLLFEIPSSNPKCGNGLFEIWNQKIDPHVTVLLLLIHCFYLSSLLYRTVELLPRCM